MSSKKEKQETIVPENKDVTDEEFISVLRSIAPGTNFRTALDGALKTGRGALIVVDNGKINPILDGGFRINCRFTPQKLIELAKMDGAIVLSKDLKRILNANVLLTPDSRLRTVETGTRHKAAERTAKHTGSLVVAISERKNEITVYYKKVRHPLVNTEEILRKANENIQLLEKQRDLFDRNIEQLTRFELRNYLSLHQAVQTIQKGLIIQNIASALQKYIIELGKEGTLLKTRLKEITSNVEKETDLIVKDYTQLDLKKSKHMFSDLSYDEILEKENILNILDYEKPMRVDPIKGWRILSKTSLQDSEIAALVKQAGTLGNAIHSSINNYRESLGDKAASFKEEIERLKISA